MSKSDESTPPPLPPEARTPPPRTAMVIPAAAVMPLRQREQTREWDIGRPPAREISVGDGNVAINVSSADSPPDGGGGAPEPDIEVEVSESSGPKPVPQDPAVSAPLVEMMSDDLRESVDLGIAPENLAPLSETPTAPLPLLRKSDDPTGEIDLAEIAENEGMPPPVLRAAAPPLPPTARETTSAGAPPERSRAGTPPPVPAGARPDPSRIPPIPSSAIDAAMRSGGPGDSWSEPLSERPRRKRTKPWFEEVFDEDYLRTLPFMTADQTLREANFVYDCLNPPQGGEVLDVACGYGRHAIELAQRGLKITGIDFSLPLLIRAADEAQRRSLAVDFVHADMRELSFDNQFHGAYCMLTSFGYFDEETNLKVASGIYRALKPGGKFLLDTLNRDYIVSDLPTRVWWEGDGCVVLEEVDFSFHTSRVNIRRSIVFQDGRQLEQDISIRAYSLHEIGRLMRQAGFRVTEVSGGLATRGRFFGATSRSLMVVCEKPPQ